MVNPMRQHEHERCACHTQLRIGFNAVEAFNRVGRARAPQTHIFQKINEFCSRIIPDGIIGGAMNRFLPGAEHEDRQCAIFAPQEGGLTRPEHVMACIHASRSSIRFRVGCSIKKSVILVVLHILVHCLQLISDPLLNCGVLVVVNTIIYSEVTSA